jgi:hypothetical protein
MGVDIRGWVEFGIFWKHEQRTFWYGAIKIDILIDRHYNMFHALFGTGLLTRVPFPPVAPNRGTPIDASSEVKKMVASDHPDFHGHSWITWQELLAIDWEEEAEMRDGAYALFSERKGIYGRSEQVNSEEMQSLWQGWTPEQRTGWEETGRVTAGDVTYKRRVKRRDIYGADWETLFSMMEALARRYGEDKVRLVVMFDC